MGKAFKFIILLIILTNDINCLPLVFWTTATAAICISYKIHFY